MAIQGNVALGLLWFVLGPGAAHERTASRRAALDGKLVVETVACPWVAVDWVANLLQLEVVDVLRKRRGGPPVRIRVECRGGRVAVWVSDPVTRKSLRREVPGLSRETPGRDRVLALSASQLLLASWMELVTPRAVAERRRPEVRAVEAARKLAVKVVRRSGVVPRAKRSFAFGVDVRSAAVDMAHPFPVFGGQVRFAYEPVADWRFFLAGAFYGGEAARESGRVRLIMGGAVLGVVWTWLRRGRYSLRAVLEGGLHELALTGLPASEDFEGRQFVHVVGSGSLGVGFGIRLGRWRLGLDLVASLVGPWVSGLVVGEPAVRPYGAWVGGGLSADFLF